MPFVIGAATVLVCRSAIIPLMGVKLMLNFANPVSVTFVWILDDVNGEIMAFLVMIVATAEAAIDLAVIVSVFKSRSMTNVDDVNLLEN